MTEPDREWRQPPGSQERPFAPYDPTPTFGGPRDNPAPEDLQVRPAYAPQPSAGGGATPQHGMSRRGALGLIAALVIGGGVYGTMHNRSHEANLTIPAAATDLKVSTGSPDVQLRGTSGASGGTVTWNGNPSKLPYQMTTSGTRATLQLSGNANEVVLDVADSLGLAVQTGSGDIDGDDLVSQRLSLRTGSGDVDVAYAEPPKDVVIETGSGDVQLRLPPGDYAFDVTSGSGDIHAPTGTGSVPIRIRTGSGDIHVTVR